MNRPADSTPSAPTGEDEEPARSPNAVIELELAAPAAWPLPEERLRAVVTRAASAALAEAAAAGAVVARDGVPPLIEVLLADDEAVRALNARWRDQDSPTNVLSFPVAGESGPWVPQAPWPLGSLVLAGGVLRREAAARAVPLAEHLSWLVIHGILHLLGYDHEREDEATRMEALERRAMARLRLADPYA